MLSYPNYSQGIMPQQNYNPYSYQQQTNYQQYQQSTNQQNSFIGKIVDSLDAVKGIDIPMDGNSYYFPKADGTEIYVKKWLPNCTTQIISYLPKIDTFNSNASISSNDTEKSILGVSEDFTKAILERLDNIDARLDKIPTTKTIKKKEVEADA